MVSSFCAPRAMLEWAQKLEAKSKYVVSGSRSDFPWQNTIKVEGDFARRSRCWKRRPSGGSSSERPSSRLRSRSYRIVVHPIISGRGPTLFHGLSSARHLELLSMQRFNSRVQALHFRRKVLDPGTSRRGR